MSDDSFCSVSGTPLSTSLTGSFDAIEVTDDCGYNTKNVSYCNQKTAPYQKTDSKNGPICTVSVSNTKKGVTLIVRSETVRGKLAESEKKQVCSSQKFSFNSNCSSHYPANGTCSAESDRKRFVNNLEHEVMTSVSKRKSTALTDSSTDIQSKDSNSLSDSKKICVTEQTCEDLSSIDVKDPRASHVSSCTEVESPKKSSPDYSAKKESPNMFVKDWEFVQTLGEGAYGEVKLAFNMKTKEAVAVKIIDTTTKGMVMDDIRKEVCIHRMINHTNIIKFYGVRKDGPVQYLFLEYASGGELFDRIEPDVGMPQAEAQRYFRQLCDGLEYLHGKGIAHRDIKPENLLLDENDNLKIADFGLATVFRHQGKWRYLERVCGSAPYLAPEVMCKPYTAEPADIWSCGIVLVAMLGGELPWDAPLLSCVQYCDWRECHIENKPWCKIDNLALCLIRRILADKPDKRYTMPEIRKNQWFNKDFSKDSVDQLSAGPRRFSRCGQSPGAISSSQPEISCSSYHLSSSDEKGLCSGMGDADVSVTHCFSQPVKSDNMLLSSQLPGTPCSSQTPLQKLVRRMTRFFSKCQRLEVIGELDRIFTIFGYSWKQSSLNVMTVNTTDRRQSLLTFKVMILEMGESQLVDFRLSKGDGLEFKRHFLRIRELMKAFICKVPPAWPNLPNT